MTQAVSGGHGRQVKVAVCQLNTIVGDLPGNLEKISDAAHGARDRGARLALFPELAIPGYPPLDLLERPSFLRAVQTAEEELIQSLPPDLTAVFGTVRTRERPSGRRLQNVATVAQRGRALLRVAKTLLPTYDVFDEARHFEPRSTEDDAVFELEGTRFGVTICEDIWNDEELWNDGEWSAHAPGSFPGPERIYRRDPVQELTASPSGRPAVVLNLSASPWSMGKESVRRRIAAQIGQRHGMTTIYCNLVGANDGLLFDGHSTVFDARGQHRWTAPGWTSHLEVLDLDALPQGPAQEREPLKEVCEGLCVGIRDYLDKIGLPRAWVGLSGGIDSAVTGTLAVRALGPERVRALAMPSPYSSDSSVEDALTLAQNLGIACEVVRIDDLFGAFRTALEPLFRDRAPDVTEENLQSRIRGTLLMAAANKFGGVVLNTGNKAEAAMGYATLYGDAIGALSVLGDLYKHQVYGLAEVLNREGERPLIPESTLCKPPSAELRPDQKDEDSLPPYDQLDRMLYMFLERREPPEVIAIEVGVPQEVVRGVIGAVYRSEFKRKQLPPTLRVSRKAWVGRCYPIVQRYVES